MEGETGSGMADRIILTNLICTYVCMRAIYAISKPQNHDRHYIYLPIHPISPSPHLSKPTFYIIYMYLPQTYIPVASTKTNLPTFPQASFNGVKCTETTTSNAPPPSPLPRQSPAAASNTTHTGSGTALSTYLLPRRQTTLCWVCWAGRRSSARSWVDLCEGPFVML